MRAVAIAMTVLLLGLAGCDNAEERAQEHFERGMELVQSGDPVKASLEFRNAIKLHDRFAAAYLELGKIEHQNGNLGNAVASYVKAIELDETLVDAHLRYGEVMLAARKLDEALSSSITAFQLAPENPDVLVLKASTQLQLGNMETALESANAALARAPDNANAHIVLAAIARRQGDLEAAMKQTDAGIAAIPGNLPLTLLRIELLTEMGRTGEIGAALQGLTDLNPETTAFRHALVRWHLSQGDLDAAEEELRVIAKIHPDDAVPALDVVRFLARVKGTDAAIAELGRLIAAAPDKAAAFPFETAMVEIDLGRQMPDEAAKRLERLISEHGASEEGMTARVFLARLRLAQDQQDSAATLLAEVLENDAKNAKALGVRGRLKIQQEDYDAAIADLRAALNEAPDDLELLQLLALANQRNGNNDLAGERLARTVEVSNYAPEYVFAYAQFLFREGKPEFATSVLEEGLRRNPNNRELLQAMAQVKLQSQEWVEAEQLAERLRQLDTRGEAAADRILAATLAGQEKFDETIQLLERSGGENAGVSSNMEALVATYLRAGEADKAVRFLEDAIAANPGSTDALVLMASVQATQGDVEAAETTFRAAIAANPDVPRGYSALSQFYVSQGRRDDAEAVTRDGLDATGNPGLRLALALLLEARGEIAAAIAEYEILYDLQPNSEVVANNLASLLADNNPDAATIERAFVIAKRLRNARMPQFKDTYGWLLHLRGDHSNALVVLQEAAEALPTNPVVQYHLGAVLAKLGENGRAKEALQTALELGKDSALPQMVEARNALAALQTGGE